MWYEIVSVAERLHSPVALFPALEAVLHELQLLSEEKTLVQQANSMQRQVYHIYLTLILYSYLPPLRKLLLCSQLSVSILLAELSARRFTTLGNSEDRTFFLVQCDILSNLHGTLYAGKIQEVFLEQIILVEINI